MSGSVGQYTITWFPWAAAKTQTNWDSRYNGADQLGMTRLFNDSGSGVPQNGARSWDFWLDSVTWKFPIIFQTWSDRAILTFKLDSTTVGAVDAYSAGQVQNVYNESLTTTVATPAVVNVNVSTATKNASSSNYYFALNSMALIRTGGTPSTPGGTDTPGYTWEWMTWMGEKASVGAVSRLQGSARLGGGIASAGAAQNNERTVDLWVDLGTFKVPTISYKDTNLGILDVQLDGVSVGTTDTYAAVGSDNNYAEVTTTLAVSTAGIKTLKLLGATKNASSTGYQLWTNSVKVIRTGP